MKKKPELLLPAGESKSVYMAFAAGADAVYLGAALFSARAYARNLSGEEICEALDYAHLFGKKIYLACNILMRNSELDLLPSVMDPLYEHGLDGVIVQDIGLLEYFSKRYPLLPLHASTQMSILSSCGCEWLKKHNVTRVVPGRELSIKEIKGLKDTGMEIECFIHGAMCYSYSGKCLMSSLAGGRSGNRGKCAGPCRQRYTAANGKCGYLISMKDMNSLNAIPELIDAGVDSFKIEGRMKAPEYVAGTAEIYRRCIDSYLDTGHMEIKESERKQLDTLYIRSERQEGYLHKHNGADMLSVSSPAYTKVPEELKQDIALKYADKRLKLKADMKFYAHVGEASRLIASCGEAVTEAEGDIPGKAVKAPLSDEEIIKRLKKTGDTFFTAATVETDTDDDIFMPVSALNELRRKALSELESSLLGGFKRTLPPACGDEGKGQVFAAKKKPYISVSVYTKEQLSAAAEKSFADRIVLMPELFGYEDIRNRIVKGTELYMALPGVIRQKDIPYLTEMLEKYHAAADGVCVGSIDGLYLAQKFFAREYIHADAGLYVMNDLSAGMILKDCASYTLCPEQNRKEYEKAAFAGCGELAVYGRMPVMYSANCIQKTVEGCDGSKDSTYITDMAGRRFPVLMDHRLCYNIILNCVPTSLHKEFYGLYEEGRYAGFGLAFTTESREEMLTILEMFERALWGEAVECGFEFTRGHFKRGAE
ncbi:MAG: U32 family peptidase [Lachnospiraceae bacterium]|nr:U32 family peptidase [Lachnospiraceae bacterium]